MGCPQENLSPHLIVESPSNQGNDEAVEDPRWREFENQLTHPSSSKKKKTLHIPLLPVGKGPEILKIKLVNGEGCM